MPTTIGSRGEIMRFFYARPTPMHDWAKLMPPRRRARPGCSVFSPMPTSKAANLGTIKCMAPIKNSDGSAPFNPGRTLLASDRVRQVGEPVAMVVAESLAQAKDAAELIEVDYESMPAVMDPVAAAKPGGVDALRRANGQCRARLVAGRSKTGRGSLRQGKKDCRDRHFHQPRRDRPDGAACRRWRIRQGCRALRRASWHPGRAFSAQCDRSHAGRQARAGASRHQ